MIGRSIATTISVPHFCKRILEGWVERGGGGDGKSMKNGDDIRLRGRKDYQQLTSKLSSEEVLVLFKSCLLSRKHAGLR